MTPNFQPIKDLEMPPPLPPPSSDLHNAGCHKRLFLNSNWYTLSKQKSITCTFIPFAREIYFRIFIGKILGRTEYKNSLLRQSNTNPPRAAEISSIKISEFNILTTV